MQDLSISRRALFASATSFMAGIAALSRSTLAQQRPLIIGQTFIAGGLDVAEGSAGWAMVSHGVAENLFTVDRYGHVVPQLASSASRDGDMAWSVTLSPGRRFSDGTPVTASEVSAALSRNVERNPATRASVGRLQFIPIDDLTMRVITERPTPVLKSVLAEWGFAVARAGSSGPAFTGPFRVVSFETGSRLALEPNPHWQRPSSHSVTIVRFQDGQSLALAFRSGEIDLAFNLPVESLGMGRADGLRTVKTFPVAYQYLAILNTRRTVLSDERVRRAISMTIDRAQIVQAIRGGKPSASLWASIFPFGDVSVSPTDRRGAAMLLDEAGWVPGSDGVRTKNGVRLSISLWAYPQRPDLATMQPVLRSQLAAIGIAVETRMTEQATTLARSGDFDILLWAQHTAPAGDPAFFPGLFLASDGGNNFAGWHDGAMDRLVAALRNAVRPDERVAIARQIDARTREAAPVIPLVTPEWHVGLSQRLASYEPWGSDYYIVRGDLTAP